MGSVDADAGHFQGASDMTARCAIHSVEVLTSFCFRPHPPGWICEGEAYHPRRHLARGRQLPRAHIRARPRAPTIRRGPPEASVDAEPAGTVRSIGHLLFDRPGSESHFRSPATYSFAGGLLFYLAEQQHHLLEESTIRLYFSLRFTSWTCFVTRPSYGSPPHLHITRLLFSH